MKRYFDTNEENKTLKSENKSDEVQVFNVKITPKLLKVQKYKVRIDCVYFFIYDYCPEFK